MPGFLLRRFSVSPWLRESILSSRKQTTRISREDAKARRNTLKWVPWRLRGLARGILPMSIETLISHGDTEAREGRGHPLSGFLRASASLREHPGFPDRNPDSLAETRRRGGMPGFLLRKVSVSPWLRESILSSREQTTRISRKGAKARRSTLERGFLRAFAAWREKSCRCVAKPRSLTGIQRHGKAENTLDRVFSASPRLRENIPVFFWQRCRGTRGGRLRHPERRKASTSPISRLMVA
jgi:hypothetical protein